MITDEVAELAEAARSKGAAEAPAGVRGETSGPEVAGRAKGGQGGGE